MIEHWSSFLEDFVGAHSIPGLAMGVAAGNETHTISKGVAAVQTATPVSADTMFEIGSVGKLITAVLALQLSQRGALDLNARITHYLPDFERKTGEQFSSITVRMLLNHTSGLYGDYFDTQQTSEQTAIREYVEACANLPITHAPGGHFSYSNTAYALLGRLIEIATGKSWFDAVESFIFEPLGLKHSTVRLAPQHALAVSAGHQQVSSVCNVVRPIDRFTLPIGLAPAGSTIMMSCNDLLTFARAIYEDWTGAEKLLSRETLRNAFAHNTYLPSGIDHFAECWGLGFAINKSGGGLVAGHDGNTPGFSAMLRIAPQEQTALCLMINRAGSDLIKELHHAFAGELFSLASSDAHPLQSRPACNYEGRYGAVIGETCEVTCEDNTLRIHLSQDGTSRKVSGELRALDEDLFNVELPSGVRTPPIKFVFENRGSPQATGLYVGLRRFSRQH